MCGALVAVRDPFLDDNKVGAFSVRMGWEQMPLQARPFRDLARTKALLVDAANESGQDFITPAYWKALLGCSVEEFVDLSLFLYTGALRNGGVFKTSWLAQPNFEAIYEHLPREVIEQVSRSHFVMARDRFQAVAAAHAQEDWRLKRYEFNPLFVGPFVELPGKDPIAPVLYLILARAMPRSLYYTAVAESGNTFTAALGVAFEYYVGKQLALCKPEALIPEIVYDRDKKKSVDYIMVMPGLIVLVEVKATLLSEGARMGMHRLEADFDRAPGKAVRQIERTAKLIGVGHPAFKDIPRDRPRVGLIVTMEPYHLCANDLVFPNHAHTVPTWLCSARDLEHLVELQEPTCGELLLDTGSRQDKSSWSLTVKLSKLPAGRNQILQKAWETYGFS